MVPVRGYAKRRVAVLGLDGPGFTAAHALVAGGAAVTVWDEAGPNRFRAHASGLEVEDLTERDWGDLAALVVEDAALVNAETPPRLIALARAVGAPVIAARPLLAEAAAREPDVKLALLTGRNAAAAAACAVRLMDASGVQVFDLLDAAPAGPGAWIIAALSDDELACLPDIVEAEALAALSPGRETGAETLERLADAASYALIASADSRVCARLIAKRRSDHAVAISGRQVVSGGVYAAGASLFDALDGKARPAGAAPACAPREALAAGYALARRLGTSRDAGAEALEAWSGAPGYGRCALELGSVRFVDWTAAQTPAAALDALSRSGPVVWIAGPALGRHAAGLIGESRADLRAIHLVTDRSRAAKLLGEAAACTVHRDLDAALARGFHDALHAGPKACTLVYAPGSVSGHTGASFDAAARALVDRALRGDAA